VGLGVQGRKQERADAQKAADGGSRMHACDLR
jgi:hypothetical protein